MTYQRGTVTRADIIEASGLNPASVSHTVRFLLDRGILVKVGDLDSNGGRRREALSLRGEAGYFVAVDLEGQTMRFALTNLVGDIRHRWEDELEFGRPLPARKIVDNVNRVLANLTPQQAERVLAVCVNYPGLLDDKGNITAVNIGWHSFPLRQSLESVLSYPVILEHDKLCSVLAEHALGCAGMEDNTLFLIVERGIGMGMFVDGKPIRGSHDRTGEIGHAKVAPDSPVVCSCGQRGCLETVASSPSVVRQYLEESSGSSKKSVHQATDVFRRARAGDEAARVVVERAARSIGFALSHAVSLLNPGLIVLGGDLVTAEDLFVPLIWEELRRLTLPLMLEDLQIKASSLGLDIRLKGAASLAFRHAIAEPKLLAKLCRPAANRTASSSHRSEDSEPAELAK
ncbi:MAG: ROK family protein [Bryobacterales bacterium]